MPFLSLALLLLSLCALQVAGNAVGVNATHIAIGMTAPFSGLQAQYGSLISAGLRVAFAEANVAGGIQSRNLTLLTMDDGYVVNRSVANFPLLSNRTLLLAGAYGSDINAALVPLAVAAGMPNVGPFTGATATRSPFHEEIVNVRASIPDEMVVQAILLVEQLRVHRIACLYQNDSFGQISLNSITAALNHVGLEVMVAASYPTGSTAIESALETIAGYPQRAQAVVLASLESQNVKFIRLFHQDTRTDPNCTFLIFSGGATSAFANKTDRQWWPSLFFTQVVPPLDTPGLAFVTQFQSAANLYLPAGMSMDLVSFQAYMAGRLIVQVLRGIPGEITRKSFLDELYNTRLYVFGGLLIGMYSGNFSGCENLICSSNTGLRSVFPATLNPSTGAMHYNETLGYYSYSVTEHSFSITDVVRPVLFGQLVPIDDPVWQRVAETIGHALKSSFKALNAAGGINGQLAELIQWQYSGDPAPYAAALADRYALVALVGCVVNYSQSVEASAVAQIGTYQTDPLATNASYNFTEVKVQASLSLEVMALTSFALQLGLPVHLRAPATEAGQAALQLLVRSHHSLQQQPASSQTYASPAEALEGLSSGAVIVIGSDADLQTMFLALADLPQLRLLTTSPRVVHLLGSLDVPTYSQATRFHYPYMFNSSSLQVISGPEVRDAASYGQLLGGVLAKVLATVGNASLAYTTTAQVLDAWYGSQYTYNGVTLGPYYSTSCSASSTTDCECNEGVRQVTVVTATRQELPIAFTYVSSTCVMTYEALVVAASENLWYIGAIVGAVAAVVVLGLLGWWLLRHGQRDNAAAPKDHHEPFCIIFTDIQASTHLWATIPDIMTNALHIHHTLIRRLLLRYNLYEVKTIGDSFMCATRSPANAVDFALALQRELFEYDWGTDRIDTAYIMQVEGQTGKWTASHAGWNGLRVRVGIHYGLGEVVLDPVTKGYDYYGTVVNTAARVEAVCHGGQIGITQEVFDALKGEFLEEELTSLGEHLLRGLAKPVHLYQLVPSELSGRKFPLLRLEHAAAVEDLGCTPSEFSAQPSHPKSAVVPLPEAPSALESLSPGSRSSHSMSATSRRVRTSTLAVVPHWVEFHPMVRSGQLSAEDLAIRYLTVQKALMTLLETQTRRVRESSLRAYCERLHVLYAGGEGCGLEETLSSLVQRVLPAALSAVHAAGVHDCSLLKSDLPSGASTPVYHSCATSGLLSAPSFVAKVPPADVSSPFSVPLSERQVAVEMQRPLTPLPLLGEE